jgi:hypothetical protein
VASRLEGAEASRRVARTRWTEAMAAEVIGSAERSGQNLAEYCRDRGLNYERVRRWKLRLGAQRAATKRPLFVPVQVVEPAAERGHGRAESTRAGVLELAIGDCVVRACGDVSETMLVRAVRAAKEAARC